jgi:hypothetical protein
MKMVYACCSKDLNLYSLRLKCLVFQAYSSLGSMDRPSHAVPKTGYEILSHPDLKLIAEKVGHY